MEIVNCVLELHIVNVLTLFYTKEIGAMLITSFRICRESSFEQTNNTVLIYALSVMSEGNNKEKRLLW